MRIPFLPGLAFAAGLYFASIQLCLAQEPPAVPAAPQPEPSVQVPGVDLSSAREPAPANASTAVRPAPESAPSDPGAGAVQPSRVVPDRAPMIAAPPQPEPVVPPPQAAGNDSFAPGVPNLQDLAMAVPEVEVWRSNGQVPQTPIRRHRRFDLAYVVGKEPALVRLRFHPLAAGQAVVVQPGPGVTVFPPDTEFRVEKSGECVVSVALDGSFIRSDFIVHCCGVKTKVPLERASVEEVAAREEAGRSER